VFTLSVLTRVLSAFSPTLHAQAAKRAAGKSTARPGPAKKLVTAPFPGHIPTPDGAPPTAPIPTQSMDSQDQVLSAELKDGSFVSTLLKLCHLITVVVVIVNEHKS